QLPVIVYGNDGENTIGWLTTTGSHDLDRVHAEALRNIAAHHVEVEALDVADAQVVAVSGSCFATAEGLDGAFLRALAGRRGSEILVAAVPRRGVLFVGRMQDTPVVRALATHEYEQGGSRKITPLVLVIAKGELSGYVRL